MRIKVDSDATSASVSDITYSGNTISTNDKYGFLVTQSYSADCALSYIFSTESSVTDTDFHNSWNSRNWKYHLVSLSLYLCD